MSDKEINSDNDLKIAILNAISKDPDFTIGFLIKDCPQEIFSKIYNYINSFPFQTEKQTDKKSLFQQRVEKRMNKLKAEQGFDDNR